MRATIKSYNHAVDYERVGRFLVRTFRKAGGHVNWLQPRWEYMHFHPYIGKVDLHSIGVWEADGEIVGVVHPEHSMGDVYFEIDPAWGELRGEMLRYAEERISVASDGVRRLRAFINDDDGDFQRVATQMGYVKSEWHEPMSHFTIPDPFPTVPLPAGFRLKSLAEDNDLHKVDRALWRGFNHGDELPGDWNSANCGWAFVQRAPNFRKDLHLAVEAPDGSFVSYCGMWYEPVHRVAYVEPVATDPAYRRLGLGRAVVLEGIRRCGQLGAMVACVGTTMPFYLSFGFRPVYNTTIWTRECV